jgi:hypothetical protein
MKTKLTICTLTAALATLAAVHMQSSAQAQKGNVVPVTVDNFIRAETDLYFSIVALKEGRFGKLGHHRDVASVDAQTIIRMNRDTLYTSGVFR